jgi:hypothetical protein
MGEEQADKPTRRGRKPKVDKAKGLTVKLEPAQRERCQALADALGIGITVMAREAMLHGLNYLEALQNQSAMKAISRRIQEIVDIALPAVLAFRERQSEVHLAEAYSLIDKAANEYADQRASGDEAEPMELEDYILDLSSELQKLRDATLAIAFAYGPPTERIKEALETAEDEG